jgi:ubiquinone/menaquinone biosynthesis C-methylase UbiE
MSRLLAAVYDRLTAGSEEACGQAWRAELLAGLAGAVLEIGPGTGHNLAHYPDAVERLVLAEPDRHMRTKLAQRLAASRRRAEVIDAGVDRLPFDDATFDTVVSTLVLCSVPSQANALAEIRRVLRPGGSLVFLEHVAAIDRPERLVWQRRVEPVWKRIAGGCHLTRDTEAAIGAAGFHVERVQRESMRKAMPVVRPTIRGLARRTS